jgi:hypothetical protein
MMSSYVLPTTVSGNRVGNPKRVDESNRSLEPNVPIRADGWSIPAELIRHWRWRCLDEGILVPGGDLCVVSPRNGGLTPLAKDRAGAVARHDLRHTCGGRVIPVVPLTGC